MIIECHICKARVDAKPVGHVEYEPLFTERIYLLECPSCHWPLIGESAQDLEDPKKWSSLVRVFPQPRRALEHSLPDAVRLSLDEAERCMQVAAYLAAAAMAGRALEALCRHYSTKDTYLGTGLKELRDKGIIDAKLYEWSEALREQRNMAAHATDSVFNAQDAEDILSFTYAIVDYAFLLTRKFAQFQKRQKEKRDHKNPKTPKPSTGAS